MSRAGSLARAFGADGTLNTSDVSGLGALAALNTVGTSQIDDSAITNGKLAADGLDASKLTTGTLPLGRVPYIGRKNLLINGDMRIAQRGTTSTTDNNYGTVDRWMKYSSGDTAQWGQGTDAVHGTYVYWSANSSGYGNMRQKFEGMHVPTGGLEMIFSFWIKGSSTFPIRYEIWNLTDNTNISSNLDFAEGSTSWQKIAIPFTMPASASGDVVQFMVGSNGAPSNMTFYMTKAQVEVGAVATEFDWRPYAEELVLCQRYFQRGNPYMIAQGVTSGMLTLPIHPVVEFRAKPTVTAPSNPYVENSPWNSVGSVTGLSANTGHMSSRGGELGLFGTYSPSPSVGAPWLVNATDFLFSAEL